MKPLTLFCWLGCLALVASSTYGQGSDDASHDLRIGIVKADPSRLGMGFGGTYDPAHPDEAGKLVLKIVNNSKRDLTINPKHVRVYAYAGRYAPPYLQGVAFLHEGDVTVPAGKSLELLKVPLSDILDPVRLRAQRTISWNWEKWEDRPSPPASPIVRHGKDYADVVVLWAEHSRDQRVLRSIPLVLPVQNAKSP